MHHQPKLVKGDDGAGGGGDDGLMKDLALPVLFSEMVVKEELKRVVDLGPFKHKVDDGLPLRKAAFSCMATILETVPEKVNWADFMPRLRDGLGDHDDVQMLCHQILGALCEYNPAAVLSSLTALLEPLDTSINRKVKDGNVGTAKERGNDAIRSALRALLAIHKAVARTSSGGGGGGGGGGGSGSSSSSSGGRGGGGGGGEQDGAARKFFEIWERVQKRDHLHHMLKQIRADAGGMQQGGAGGGGGGRFY